MSIPKLIQEAELFKNKIWSPHLNSLEVSATKLEPNLTDNSNLFDHHQTIHKSNRLKHNKIFGKALKLLALLVCFVVFFGDCRQFIQNCEAAQLPRYLGSERKFRSYIYNPNEVYRYVGHYTYQGFIEFSESEKIATISMGNQTLWMFEILKNRLFLKPIGEDNSETNMTVITDKRVYHFELMAKEAKGINDKDLVFVAKFAYPDDKEKNLVQFPKIQPSDEPDMRDLSIYNFNYQYVGESNIAPIRVFDNGTFTYFQFSRKNSEIPAIFTVDSDGYEGLVNLRTAGDFLIVERISPQFTLRNGNNITCVYNMDLYSNGRKQSKESKSDKSLVQPMMSFENQSLSTPQLLPISGSNSNSKFDNSTLAPTPSLPVSPNSSQYELLYQPERTTSTRNKAMGQ